MTINIISGVLYMLCIKKTKTKTKGEENKEFIFHDKYEAFMGHMAPV